MREIDWLSELREKKYYNNNNVINAHTHPLYLFTCTMYHENLITNLDTMGLVEEFVKTHFQTFPFNTQSIWGWNVYTEVPNQPNFARTFFLQPPVRFFATPTGTK